ncbi:putative TIM-barrel fold metal-dependent hydrolase [Metabacillus crassostreae]|uniref:amidohydrolase family protein n=1 Tax=Metabacillus crassostreae TaxID=929098 RepID=UPI00195BD07F|nr:amidohydrolase family protein [Metabacillus crassostreae]MBM7602182.1 putative TIM-barrel fold metal-dependent hydrolase [Metabacillus crassostreae]
MIIDAHAHLSNTEYGNIELYQKLMSEIGIDQVVAVPGAMLDVRKMTEYITGRAKPDNPVPDNQYIEKACHENKNIHGFICINPHDKDVEQQLEKGKKQGFKGLKLSPLSHQFSFSSKGITSLASLCGDYDFPFYTHVVYSPGASTAKFIQLAKKFPKTKFIIGHMGFGPADQEALEAAKSLDNFFLETSTGNFLHIQESVKKVGSSKVIFGSEYPLSHPGIELEKIMKLNITDREREDIVSGNIKQLLKI